MVYILALGASLSNALTSVLQRMGVEDAPAEDSLKPRLLLHALRRGIWLAGFALMVVSFLMQAVALHFGRLSEVQPILTTELLFLVLILGSWFRFSVGWKEWLAAAAAAAGLAGFLVFAAPTGGNAIPSGLEWGEVGGACAVVVAAAVLLARRGPRWWRASMFGVAAAVAYAFTAGLTKVVTNYVAGDWVSLFRHWQTYGLAGCGVLAVFLTQNAYHAGPIAASQSTIVLVDPLASILIGVGLFGDDLRTSGAWGPLEATSLLVLFLGAIVLCRSPIIGGIKGDGGDGSEMLSGRHRLRHPPHAPEGPPIPQFPAP
ncbi:MAG: DMT family transporter [Actinomycetota bacterium]|jgi:drug/metabolite transporter (DMT)-like permease|nr:DMT family transporter [Actinomycetota bacterium]